MTHWRLGYGNHILSQNDHVIQKLLWVFGFVGVVIINQKVQLQSGIFLIHAWLHFV